MKILHLNKGLQGIALLLSLYSMASFAQSSFYVSPNGSDSDKGTLASPFKTIAKAQSVARKHAEKGAVTINLLAGDYPITSTLNFTQQDSAPAGAKVTYRSHGKAGSARLLGGEKISNWTDTDGDGIWQAKVNWHFETLYVDGSRVPKARHPNIQDYKSVKRVESDYFRIASEVKNKKFKSFNSNKDDFANFTIEQLNAEDLQIYLWPGAHDWANRILNVQFESASTLSLEKALSPKNYLGHLKKGSRYFLQGAKAFLDQPGEWYLDTAKDTLYYMPITDNPNNENIYAPKLQTLIAVKGRSPQHAVNNLVFEGLTFMLSDYSLKTFNTPDIGAITIKNAQNITVKNNRFINLAGNGVGISGVRAAVANIKVIGNYFYDIGHSGIRARGNPGTNKYSNTKHLFADNQISKIAEIATNGAGILIDNCAFCAVKNNEISNATHYGIEVKGTKHWQIRERFAKKNRKGQLVMPDGVVLDDHLNVDSNVYNYNPGRYNVVAYNRIYQVNLDTQDTGIYKSGGTFKTRIDHNLLYDSGANFGIQKGLYLDDVSDYSYITNNIIYNVISDNPSSNDLNIKGVGSEAYNNILNFNNTGTRILEFEPKGKPQPTYLNKLKHNIYYSKTSGTFYDFVGKKFYDKGVNEKGELVLLAESDNNLFYTEAGPLNHKNIRGIPGKDSLENWRQIAGVNGIHYDRHSVAVGKGTGLFVDPENGDYSILPSAMELVNKIGFKPIDTSNIGLTSAHIYTKSGEVNAN